MWTLHQEAIIPEVNKCMQSKLYQLYERNGTITFRSAKVRTTVLHFPGLTGPVKEIGFAEVKDFS